MLLAADGEVAVREDGVDAVDSLRRGSTRLRLVADLRPRQHEAAPVNLQLRAC